VRFARDPGGRVVLLNLAGHPFQRRAGDRGVVRPCTARTGRAPRTIDRIPSARDDA
jgi:hypothetical protein